MRIVITGNIGSGKSTAAKILKELLPSWIHWDFDKAVAELYQLEFIKDQLKRWFGTSDKARISDVVHASPEMMELLRNVLDPHIKTTIQCAVRHPNVVLDIPLYFEHIEGKIASPDLVLTIVATDAIRMERVKARNGFSEEKIRSIMAKQLPQGDKVFRSNCAIANNTTVEDLTDMMNEFVLKYDLLKK